MMALSALEAAEGRLAEVVLAIGGASPSTRVRHRRFFENALERARTDVAAAKRKAKRSGGPDPRALAREVAGILGRRIDDEVAPMHARLDQLEAAVAELREGQGR